MISFCTFDFDSDPDLDDDLPELDQTLPAIKLGMDVHKHYWNFLNLVRQALEKALKQVERSPACEEVLNDKTSYEELPVDPNPNYREELDKIILEMEEDNFVNKAKSKILRSERTPVFYGLLKIHKKFARFPPMRPICSRYECCIANILEWLDGFLIPVAKRSSSYIRDTFDFVSKINNFFNHRGCIKNCFLVTMDVSSLYPNIDHNEGVEACMDAFEKQSNKSIPSNFLCRLLRFVLENNTMKFRQRFYHQVKDCTMGTPA
ncbi:uncharacterized protein LOC115222486 [Octopus sinensis]|uniref:Uncharacterized protein LOC115222486 n=1 Tax=Octopus sinensis TaxID=2607531 RepID=A0A6P7TE26_9MOLL|nr:uncharacterized protein LOC115222486 [Octopus sinensis]